MIESITAQFIYLTMYGVRFWLFYLSCYMRRNGDKDEKEFLNSGTEAKNAPGAQL